ncbi:hypothetical protein INR49_025598 [Caranx melampygus]|nr:hypothetical protein INR49_025598 [Caranx melampygus]
MARSRERGGVFNKARVTSNLGAKPKVAVRDKLWVLMVMLLMFQSIVQPEEIRGNLVGEVMEYQFHRFGSSDDNPLNEEIKITAESGMKRIVAFVLYGILVLLLLILLLVTGVKFSQLNQEITNVRLHLEKMNHAGSSAFSSAPNSIQKKEPVKGGCKDGWMSFKTSCYLLSHSTATWSKAEELCLAQGGHLLVLNNVEELDYISSVVEPRYAIWIGLVERQQEGHWTWVDGTDFNSTPTYWDDGQPDDWALRENGEDCGQLHGSAERKRRLWNDADCTLQYRYICESRV